MPYKILHASQIDVSKWNSSIRQHQRSIYSEFYFLNAVCQDNWYGIIWGDYEKVFPFYAKKKWGIFPYLTMPPFCQQFLTNHLTAIDFNTLLKELKSKYIAIDWRIGQNFQLDNIEKKRNYIIDKSTPKKDYSRLVQKNLTQYYHKIDLEISSTELFEFLKQNEEFQSIHYANFSRQFEFLMSCENIKKDIRGIRIQGKLEAAIVSVFYESTIYLLFPHSSSLAKQQQAMTHLIHSIISDNRYNIIDFEGSSIESIARFYSQFGAKEDTYYGFTYRKWKL